MTTHDHETCNHEGIVAIGIPAAQAENLAKILLQFDAHVPADAIDFEFDRNLWQAAAVDLLKASAVHQLARNGVPIHPLVMAAEAMQQHAAAKLVTEAENHLKSVAPE